VPHGDDLELAVALIELMSDAGLRERLGHAGRAAYHAHYRVERMLDDTEALYRELLGAAGARAPAQVAKGNGRLRVT
jgi:glycosyltransferase involved in cell wall biosynthesis